MKTLHSAELAIAPFRLTLVRALRSLARLDFARRVLFRMRSKAS